MAVLNDRQLIKALQARLEAGIEKNLDPIGKAVCRFELNCVTDMFYLIHHSKHQHELFADN
jgi:hypothetical protein